MNPGTMVQLPDGRRGYFQVDVKGVARVLVEEHVPTKSLKEVKK